MLQSELIQFKITQINGKCVIILQIYFVDQYYVRNFSLFANKKTEQNTAYKMRFFKNQFKKVKLERSRYRLN